MSAVFYHCLLPSSILHASYPFFHLSWIFQSSSSLFADCVFGPGSFFLPIWSIVPLPFWLAFLLILVVASCSLFLALLFIQVLHFWLLLSSLSLVFDAFSSFLYSSLTLLACLLYSWLFFPCSSFVPGSSFPAHPSFLALPSLLILRSWLFFSLLILHSWLFPLFLSFVPGSSILSGYSFLRHQILSFILPWLFVILHS